MKEVGMAVLTLWRELTPLSAIASRRKISVKEGRWSVFSTP
jgi:hypothetical protein